jgi:crossover junction endodeoxyribonuclease RuvC
MGVDPGSRYTGWGLVVKESGRLSLLEAGRIAAKADAPLAERLHRVYEGLREVLGRHQPEQVSIEDIFYARNVKTAVRLGHVRGVALLAAAESRLPVFEYSPAAIKMAVVGYGRADKSQVALMIGKILNVKGGLPEDATDAVAAAVCHLHRIPALKAQNS